MIGICGDMNHVRHFMRLPEIWRYAAEFGCNDDCEFYADDRRVWLAYYVDNKQVGLIDYHLETGCMAQFHPYILREFKGFYDQMVIEFFEWVKENSADVLKLNVVIPETCKGAIKAANKAGMKLEGIDRFSYLTEAGPINRMMFGILKEDL